MSEYTFPLLNENGLVFTEVEEARILVQTGVSESRFVRSVCGRDSGEEPFYRDKGGDPTKDEYVMALAWNYGTTLDGVLGADLLNEYDVVFDSKNKSLTLSEEFLELEGADQLPLDIVLGVPVLAVRINASPFRLFFDTGSPVSFLQEKELLESFRVNRSKELYVQGKPSFHGTSRFVDVTLGRKPITMEFAHVPGLEGEVMGACEVKGILGNQILRNKVVLYSARRRLIAF